MINKIFMKSYENYKSYKSYEWWLIKYLWKVIKKYKTYD
jgi:hypothetical protein